jgi:putative aldouronate transport system substrate-binding protein
MIASKELPDLMVYNWKNVPGGVEQFYEDGYIIDLTDLYTTNLSNVYKALENVDALGHIKATDGKYYYIPEVSDTKGSGVYLGFVIRQDMLDELNVKTPTTLDEYHALLTQAKEHYGKDFYPMTGSSFKNVALGIGNLLWAFGITSDLYLDGDTVCYGPMSGRFADAMGYIQKLYAEGLIDPDYATQDRNAEKGKMMSDSSMVTFEFQPTAMMTAMADVNPKFKLVGITNLKETADSKPYTFDSNYNSVLQYGDDVAITTSCEDPVKACNFMNYIFSEEGYNITNYGVEHTSWEFDANGKPQFNDAYAAVDNAERVLYNFGAASVFPSLRSYETYKYSLSETAAAAIDTWRSTNDTSKILPVVMLTQEEKDAITDDFADINTYMDEVYAKLVNGQMSISDIPNVQQKLKEMNIDKIVAAYQAAYDRYK